MNTLKLAAKVRAVNKANTRAMELWSPLRDFFKPYVGCKVLRKDDSLVKNIQDILPNMDTPGIQVYRYNNHYNIWYMIRVCENIDENTCLYNETGIFVAHVRDSILISLYESGPTLRIDYSVDEIIEAFSTHDTLKGQADEAIEPYRLFQNF